MSKEFKKEVAYIKSKLANTKKLMKVKQKNLKKTHLLEVQAMKTLSLLNLLMYLMVQKLTLQPKEFRQTNAYQNIANNAEIKACLE